MLKDRAQKASILRLIVNKHWLPQLEVEVEPTQSIDTKRSLLTDLDVLAVAPSESGRHSKFVFDCKSGMRESAISRAFWLHGVIARTQSTRGFVILNNRISISRDHRISASDFGITLLHESEIENLAKGIGSSVAIQNALSADINIWEEFLDIKTKYSGLANYLDFSRSTYWMKKSPGERCRKLIGILRRIRSEIDPAKREHLAVFGDALCLFLYAVSEMATDLFFLLLKPASRDEYTDLLLAVLYGGNENIEVAQKIKRIALGADEDDSVNIFPDLPRFEHLIREIVEAPLQALPAALLARELSFRNLTVYHEGELPHDIITRNPHATKFIYLASLYLTKALHLPPEFSEHYLHQLAEVDASSSSR